MSSKIAYLEDQLKHFNESYKEDVETYTKNPTQANKFFMDGSESYIKDTQQQLHIEKAARAKELLSVRLHGGSVGHGSIPLKLLARFSLPFVEAIEHAAFRLNTGQIAKQIPSDLSSMLDIELAGINTGSADLQILGNIAPDLTGHSVLETTLDKLFNLLKSDYNFTDAIDSIGAKSAHKLAEAFKALVSDNSEVDFKWASPSGKEYYWQGHKQQLTNIISKIESLSEPETLEQNLLGVIRSISDTGHFYIQSGDKKLKINYGLKEINIIEQLHIKQNIHIKVTTEKRHDKVSHSSIDTHYLKSLIN